MTSLPAGRPLTIGVAEQQLIVEGAPGVPLPVSAAIENTCTDPHNLRVYVGNPDNQHDTLHEFCTSQPRCPSHQDQCVGSPESFRGVRRALLDGDRLTIIGREEGISALRELYDNL